MNEVLTKIELGRYSFRSTLYAVFSEKELQSYYDEMQDVFFIRFDANKAKDFALEKAEVERDINYEPTERFRHLAFVQANAWADFARHEDVYDQMIEANIAVFQGKETIAQARKRVHMAKVEVKNSLDFHGLMNAHEREILKLMCGSHLYKSRGVGFSDEDFEIRPDVKKMLNREEFDQYALIYLKRLSDKYQSLLSRTGEAFF